VARRSDQIIERVVTGHASAGGSTGTDRVTATALSSREAELSVLVVKHDRTSSLNAGEVRSIADAYVRWITDAETVKGRSSEASAHNRSPYINGRIRAPAL